jgi:hypothetical protein
MARPLREPGRAPASAPLQKGLLRGLPLLATALAAVLGFALLARATTGSSSGTSSGQGNTATVQEILDGNQFYIEQKQAKVRDGAKAPDRLRSGNSRAQMAFQAGGTARINRFSQMKLGTSCFFLTRGQVLVSGPQNGCTRSSRLSVRGTNYLISVTEAGQAELTVLEGQVMVEGPERDKPSPHERPTAVFGGNRVSLGADGRLSDRRRLSEAEVAAILNGPLFQGFLTPLSHQQALQSFLQRAYPNLKTFLPQGTTTAATTVSDASANALQAAINDIRLQQGRPPFQDLPADLAARNRDYLRPVLQAIRSSGNCDHDRTRWQAFQASLGAAGLQPSSEVLTCGGPLRNWDPRQVVTEWLSSPLHRSILLERPRASNLGCSSLSETDQTVVICTLWSPKR